eukprot:scaffold36078_cov48-Phaeocystis_antarctica.AAC.1
MPTTPLPLCGIGGGGATAGVGQLEVAGASWSAAGARLCTRRAPATAVPQRAAAPRAGAHAFPTPLSPFPTPLSAVPAPPQQLLPTQPGQNQPSLEETLALLVRQTQQTQQSLW